jgi:FixJ family two-component response regulator
LEKPFRLSTLLEAVKNLIAIHPMSAASATSRHTELSMAH